MRRTASLVGKDTLETNLASLNVKLLVRISYRSQLSKILQMLSQKKHTHIAKDNQWTAHLDSSNIQGFNKPQVVVEQRTETQERKYMVHGEVFKLKNTSDLGTEILILSNALTQVMSLLQHIFFIS